MHYVILKGRLFVSSTGEFGELEHAYHYSITEIARVLQKSSNIDDFKIIPVSLIPENLLELIDKCEVAKGIADKLLTMEADSTKAIACSLDILIAAAPLKITRHDVFDHLPTPLKLTLLYGYTHD